VGLAVANQFGNHEQDLVAIAAIVASVIYVFIVLKPFKQKL
jgi:hypothetical protein